MPTTPSDYTLLAKYPMEQIVRGRNYVGLNNWSADTTALPIPSVKPDPSWVQLRLVAERYPQQPEAYVQRTLSYFLQDQVTQTNIRQYLTTVNTEAVETALAAQIAQVIERFMPQFAAMEITASQIEQWYTDHGFGAAASPASPGQRRNPMNTPMPQ